MEFVSQDTSPYSLIPVVLLFLSVACFVQRADCLIIQYSNWFSLVTEEDGFSAA